ncbi:MAG: GGDEF domain-containing protein, partial [Rhodococcus sp. (in: high G+C Gram-positive bacteria)]
SQFESGDTGSVVNTGMHLADIAMYRAKSAGRNTVVMFDAPAGTHLPPAPVPAPDAHDADTDPLPIPGGAGGPA